MRFFKATLILILLYLSSCKTKNERQSDIQFVSLINIYVSQESSSQCEIQLTFKIKDGYHIQSENPQKTDFIPTQIKISDKQTISIDTIYFNYTPSIWSVDQENFHEVISDTFMIDLLMKIPNYYTKKKIDLSLYYQTCDDKKCYFPRNLPVVVNLR